MIVLYLVLVFLKLQKKCTKTKFRWLYIWLNAKNMFSIWSFLIHTFLYLHCFYQGLSFLQVVALFFYVCDILCMFWGNFLASFLTDDVHFKDAANTIMSDFMLSLLESKRKYKPLNLSNILFRNFLVEPGIGSPAHIAMEEEEMDNLKAALQEPSF